MRELTVTIYMQICVLTLLIMVILAVAISVIISTRLNDNIGLLEDHGAAMMAGTEIDPSDPFSIPSMQRNVSDLRWITYIATTGSFVVLYLGFLGIIWRGSDTMREQRQELERRVQELTALNTLFQRYLEEGNEGRPTGAAEV